MMKKICAMSIAITRIRCILAVCCCGLSLFLFACSSQPVENNIFLYAIDSSESLLHPKNVDFNMSVEEVLKAVQLSESDIDKRLGEDQPRIITSVSISGVSDEIQEVFSFQDGKLVTVEYVIKVSDSDFEKVCKTMAEQAASGMPADLLMGENNILKGKGAMWEDREKNMVILSFPETNVSGTHVILLDICMGKN